MTDIALTHRERTRVLEDGWNGLNKTLEQCRLLPAEKVVTPPLQSTASLYVWNGIIRWLAGYNMVPNIWMKTLTLAKTSEPRKLPQCTCTACVDFTAHCNEERTNHYSRSKPHHSVVQTKCWHSKGYIILHRVTTSLRGRSSEHCMSHLEMHISATAIL